MNEHWHKISFEIPKGASLEKLREGSKGLTYFQVHRNEPPEFDPENPMKGTTYISDPENYDGPVYRHAFVKKAGRWMREMDPRDIGL